MNTILTREFLENLYSKKNLKVRDISQKTGFSYSYLQSKIHSFGIQRKRQYTDLKGKAFDYLTVIEFSHTDDRKQSWWKCQCKCGKTKIVKASALKSKDAKSCGCKRKTSYGEIPGGHFANIKSRCRWYKIRFDLNIKDIWDLFMKQNRKCALSGVEIKFSQIRGETTASLDRIDSSKGYTIDNVQWVHKDINQMKSDRSDEEFLKWVGIIFEFQKLK